MSNELAAKIEQQYNQILQYKQQFHTKWAEHERFYAGDQWPAPTPRTKDLPRPVFNIIQRILDHKVASVMAEQPKITYIAYDADQNGEDAADIFSKYADILWEELKQDAMNEELLLTAGQTGEGILHFFFDSSITGGNKTQYMGKIQGETLDPVNVFFENQQQSDAQKQKYIIITARMNVSEVKEIAKGNGVSAELLSSITSDEKQNEEAYDSAKREVKDSDKVTVLTKYEKIGESVYFTKVASSIVIQEQTKTPMKRYPLANMIWRKRKKSAHGVSDVEGIIPNQKSINFLMAMQLLGVQNVGFPKVVYNPNYLMVRPTNEPGQLIPSTAPAGEKVIEYLQPPPMNSAAASLIRDVLEFTKEMAGANENALGEQQSAQLNAAAIMMLQKAANVPIESIKRRFYSYIEDIARIWEDMLKGYYNVDRSIRIQDDEQQEQQMNYNFAEAEQYEFSMKIEVAATSGHSEALIMQTLDKFLDMFIQTQGAVGIDFKTYLQLLPKQVAPYKERLLKQMDDKAQQDVQQNQGQQAQQMQQDQQAQMMQQQQQAMQQQQMGNQQQKLQLEAQQNDIKQRKLNVDHAKTSETQASQDVQSIRDSVPQSIQMQIDEWLKQGISNREIINRLMSVVGGGAQ